MRLVVLLVILIIFGVLAVPVVGNVGVGKLSKKGKMVDAIIFKRGEFAGYGAALQGVSPEIRILSEYKRINGAHVQIPPNFIEKLKQEGYVVEENRLVPLALDSSNAVILSDRAKRAGFKGSGVKVCILDTGIDFYHTQLPIPPSERMADWLNMINGPYQPDTNGTTHTYTIYVNESLSTLNFSINWATAENRFDFFVYYPNGSYAGGTNGSTPYFDVYWWLTVNLTDAPAGYYNITTNDTRIINPSGEWFTLYWDPRYPSAGIFISDFGGHGTHVAGIIAGNNTTYEGVAPNVTLYIGTICDGYSSPVHGCPTSSILDGMQWCVDNNVDIISMSIGASDNTGNCNDSMALMADSIADLSLPVIAAGNNGPSSGSVTSPGCARKAMGVGSVDDNGGLASYSGRGPTGDGRIKPDVVAPGVNIISTWPINTFQASGGTSMATPHCAGAAAIAKEANPNWTPAILKAGLMASAVKSSGGAHLDNDYGAGLVDVMGLINGSHYDIDFSVNVSILHRGEPFGASSRWKSAVHGYTMVNASNNTNSTVDINVPNNAQSLKVLLYWEENATDTRSQIHLYLIEPNGTVVDNSSIANSTAQMVYNASPVNGTWKVNVSGVEVYNNNTIVFFVIKLYDNSFAYAEYNISSGFGNFTASADKEWANITNTTNDWALGPHLIRFYSNNSFGNWSVTEEKYFTLLGWSELNESVIPTNVDEDLNFEIGCRVRDANTSNPIENYNITFWDNATYLGSNRTGSSGWANITINYSQPGTYQIICNITDDAEKFYNDTASTQSSIMTVNDVTAPQYSNLKNTSAVYGLDWQGNVTWEDNVDISHVLFESNFTGTSKNYSAYNSGSEYYFTITAGNLSGGKVVAWRWIANDSSGNENSTEQGTFVVSKAASGVRLFLNGTEGNRSYARGDIVNLTASVNVSGKNVILEANFSVDYYVFENNTESVANLTNTSGMDIREYNITAYFVEDENFTGYTVTYFLNLLKSDGESCSAGSECYSGICCSGSCAQSCPSGYSGGTSGGTAVAAAPSTKIVNLNEKFVEVSSYQATFSPGDEITYEFKGVEHKINVLEVTAASVTLSIASDEYNITLTVGEIRDIDLDKDSVGDLRITLSAITDSMAVLVFTVLEQAEPSEEAPAKVPEEAKENVTQPVEAERPKEETPVSWELAFGLFVLIMALIAFALLYRKPGKQR